LPEIRNQSGNEQSTSKYTLNRSKTITSIAIFAAIAIVLQILPLRIPAPYLPFLIYEFWEIPIIVAFYLYGARIGLAVASINFLSLLVIVPGSLQAGPIYNLLAILGMILGLLAIYRVTGKISRFKSARWLFWLTIIVAPLVRVLFMTAINTALLPMSAPLGYEMSYKAIMPILPLIGFFNFSVALYSILIARTVSRVVSKVTRIPIKYGV